MVTYLLYTALFVITFQVCPAPDIRCEFICSMTIATTKDSDTLFIQTKDNCLSLLERSGVQIGDVTTDSTESCVKLQKLIVAYWATQRVKRTKTYLRYPPNSGGCYSHFKENMALQFVKIPAKTKLQLFESKYHWSGWTFSHMMKMVTKIKDDVFNTQAVYQYRKLHGNEIFSYSGASKPTSNNKSEWCRGEMVADWLKKDLDIIKQTMQIVPIYFDQSQIEWLQKDTTICQLNEYLIYVRPLSRALRRSTGLVIYESFCVFI